jgi:DNA-directed RNA polymerase subunit RPC12/RpoP
MTPEVLSLVILGASLAIVVVALIIPLRSPFAKSRLKCPSCSNTFDYNWAFWGSLASVGLERKRRIRCPNCQKWSDFDIRSARIKKEAIA